MHPKLYVKESDLREVLEEIFIKDLEFVMRSPVLLTL